MKWPWVSRGRYEEAKERIADMKEEIRDLKDRLERRDRRKAGMPEDPDAERPSPSEQRDPMPEEIRGIIAGFDSPHMRTSLKRKVRLMRKRKGLSWEEVKTQLRLAVEGQTAPTSRGRSGVTSPENSSPPPERS